jgi:hypothetical protein
VDVIICCTSLAAAGWAIAIIPISIEQTIRNRDMR